MKFSKGTYQIVNPEKYAGVNTPTFRSSWEFNVMRMCDLNPAIVQWASESIRIPYRDPFTGKPTVYIPDFFVVYIDNKHQKHAEIWEIKPKSQALRENVGKSQYNQIQFVKNTVKWAAARNYCKTRGIQFRVLTEDQLFHTGKKI